MSDWIPTRCADPDCFVVAKIPKSVSHMPWLCRWHRPAGDGQTHD